MNQLPEHLRYTAQHAWLQDNEDGTFTVGITDFAQNALNDVVFTQLPHIGLAVQAGEAIALVESVKSASDVYAPVTGKIVLINEKLALSPELINTDPYGEGWLFHIRPDRTEDVNALLNFSQYQSTI